MRQRREGSRKTSRANRKQAKEEAVRALVPLSLNDLVNYSQVLGGKEIFDQFLQIVYQLDKITTKEIIETLFNPDKFNFTDEPEFFQELKEAIRVNPGWFGSKLDPELKLLVLNEVSNVLLANCPRCGGKLRFDEKTERPYLTEKTYAIPHCETCGFNGTKIPVFEREF